MLYTHPNAITLMQEYGNEAACLKDMKRIKQEFEEKVEAKCLPLLEVIE